MVFIVKNKGRTKYREHPIQTSNKKSNRKTNTILYSIIQQQITVISNSTSKACFLEHI
jgi:hypothetical protein